VGERLSSGMTLCAALEQQFDGKYNVFHGKAVGQKKLHLDSLVQQTLDFAPSQPGELIGATAEDEMMGMNGRGLMRAILELLIEAFAYEEDEGKPAKEILEELSNGDWDDYFEQEPRAASGRPQQTEELSLPVIRAALKVMGRPNGNRPEIVLRAPGPRFYLNAEGVDMLPGRDDPVAAVANANDDDDDAVLFGESQVTYDGSEADEDEYGGAASASTSSNPMGPPPVANVPSAPSRSISAPAGPPIVSSGSRPPSFGHSASFWTLGVAASSVSRRERELGRAQQAAAETLNYQEASQEASDSLPQDFFVEEID